MISRRRAATFSVVGSSANTIVITIQAFILVPLALKHIGPELYGAWVGSGGLLLWLQVFDLGFPNLLIQRVGAAYGRGDLRSAADYFVCGVAVIGVLAIVVVAIGMAIARVLPGWLDLDGADVEPFVSSFRLAVLGSGLGVFSHAFVGLSRAIQRTGVVAAGVVAGSVIGFAATVWLLLAGLGLWAFALGIVLRSIVVFVVGLGFAVTAWRRWLEGRGRIRLRFVREYLLVSPPSALGVMGYATMGQGETALVAIFVSTDAALVYSLTRRAADTVNAVLDMVGVSAYGGFSHLVGSGEVERVGPVYRELWSLRLALFSAGGACLLALNPSFVSLWVGAEYYGGFWLNLLVVLQLGVVGQSFLLNNLYRSAGPVLRSSVALSGESVVRFAVSTAAVTVLGYRWIPAAGMVVGLVFGLLYWRWLAGVLGLRRRQARSRDLAPWLGRSLLLGAGLWLSLEPRLASWPLLSCVALGMGILSAIAIWSCDSGLRVLVRSTVRTLVHTGRGSG